MILDTYHNPVQIHVIGMIIACEILVQSVTQSFPKLPGDLPDAWHIGVRVRYLMREDPCRTFRAVMLRFRLRIWRTCLA